MRYWLFTYIFFTATLHADLNSLESLTGQWISLRSERAQEAESWKLEQNRLQMELRLLEDAEAHLREELDALQQAESETETQQTELLQELEDRQHAQSTLRPVIQHATSRLLDATAPLPPPLLRRLADDRAAVDASGTDILPRIRALLGLHNQWILLQTSIHAGPMVIERPDERREMDVLWIGSARAYAVNADNTLAAIGTPGPNAWQWSEANEIAPRVRQALRIHQQEVPPALIRLPVKVEIHAAEGKEAE